MNFENVRNLKAVKHPFRFFFRVIFQDEPDPNKKLFAPGSFYEFHCAGAFSLGFGAFPQAAHGAGRGWPRMENENGTFVEEPELLPADQSEHLGCARLCWSQHLAGQESTESTP